MVRKAPKNCSHTQHNGVMDDPLPLRSEKPGDAHSLHATHLILDNHAWRIQNIKAIKHEHHACVGAE